ASVIEDPDEKAEVLQAMTDHLIRGRWQEIRLPTAQELKRTVVLAIPIQEASAKVRVGPPLDDEADYQLPVWAGVIPLRLVASDPAPDPRLQAGILPPKYATCYAGPRGLENGGSQPQ